jgi:hypothetical protein
MTMEPIWLLKAPHEAPGWTALEKDARNKTVNVLLFDRDRWALVRAPAAPTEYEGFVATPAPSGMYLDQQGRSVYVAAGIKVHDPREVIAALGAQATELLNTIGDPNTVLERLGRVY